MSAKKVIEIIVHEDGTLEAETFGMKGEECIHRLTELLDGLVDVEGELKPEYYDDASAQVSAERDESVSVGGD